MEWTPYLEQLEKNPLYQKYMCNKDEFKAQYIGDFKVGTEKEAMDYSTDARKAYLLSRLDKFVGVDRYKILLQVIRQYVEDGAYDKSHRYISVMEKDYEHYYKKFHTKMYDDTKIGITWVNNRGYPAPENKPTYITDAKHLQETISTLTDNLKYVQNVADNTLSNKEKQEAELQITQINAAIKNVRVLIEKLK